MKQKQKKLSTHIVPTNLKSANTKKIRKIMSATYTSLIKKKQGFPKKTINGFKKTLTNYTNPTVNGLWKNTIEKNKEILISKKDNIRIYSLKKVKIGDILYWAYEHKAISDQVSIVTDIDIDNDLVYLNEVEYKYILADNFNTEIHKGKYKKNMNIYVKCFKIKNANEYKKILKYFTCLGIDQTGQTDGRNN